MVTTGSSSVSRRFFSWAAPVFALLIAALLTGFPRRTSALGGALVVGLMLLFTGMELRNHVNDNWREMLATMNAGWQPGDVLFCFPISSCVPATAFYLPAPVPLKGGGIYDDGLKFSDPGYIWNGFSDLASWEKSVDDVDDRIDADAAGAGRIWLIAGAGKLGFYPDSELLSKTMGRNWKVEQTWDYSTLLLKLYVPRRG